MEKSRVEELIGEPVSEFTVSAGSKAGDGVASSLKSIQIKTIAGQELNVVLKEIDKESPWAGEQVAEDNGAFKIENLVYSKLLPKLTEFAKSRGVESQLAIPRCFSTYQGTVSGNNYICMEDVRFQGYRMTDKYAGLTLDEMLLVMSALANFHALTHALIKWEGEKIFAGELHPFVEYFGHDAFSGQLNPKLVEFGGIVQKCSGNALAILEKRNEVLYQKLKLFLDSDPTTVIKLERFFATGYGTDFKYFPVIAHGDAWQNNFLFKYDPNGKATSLKLIDFQFTRRGNIFDDLLYTIFTSSTPTFRRHHLSTILRQYYDTFSSRLKELKTHHPIGFTFGSFVDAFNDNIPSVYRYMFFAIPLQLGTSLPDIMTMMPPPPPPVEGQGPPSQEEQMEMFNQIMLKQMETSVKAIDRLEAITQEMVDLKIL